MIKTWLCASLTCSVPGSALHIGSSKCTYGSKRCCLFLFLRGGGGEPGGSWSLAVQWGPVSHGMLTQWIDGECVGKGRAFLNKISLFWEVCWEGCWLCAGKPYVGMSWQAVRVLCCSDYPFEILSQSCQLKEQRAETPLVWMFLLCTRLCLEGWTPSRPDKQLYAISWCSSCICPDISQIGMSKSGRFACSWERYR